MAAITSAADGTWVAGAATTWTGGVAPGEGDNAIIASTHDVEFDNNVTVGPDSSTAAIEVQSGGRLFVPSTVAGNYTLICKGDIKTDATGGTIEFGTVANPIPNTRTFTLKLNYSASLADGKYGLLIRAGGTFTCQGASDRITVDRAYLAADAGGYCNTSGTAVTRLQGQTFTGMSGTIKINGVDYTISSVTDADHIVLSATAGTQTSVSYVLDGQLTITTDVSTGWKSGDKIAIASTSRTYTDCFTTTLNGNASGTTVTLTDELIRAHIGTSPCQAEVINLTRNVVVTSHTTTAVGYVQFATTATVDVDWTEFSYLGEDAAGKRGIDIQTTSGSCNLNRCAFHDFEDYGIYFSGATIDNVSITYNCLYNLASVAGNSVSLLSSTQTPITYSNNWLIYQGGNVVTVYISTTNAVIDDNVIAGGRSYGMQLAALPGASGSIDGNVIHSGGNVGFYIGTNLGNYGTVYPFGTLTAWRNTQSGLNLTSTSNIEITSVIAWGNGTQNIFTGGTHIVYDSLTLNGDTVFSTAGGIAVNGITQFTVRGGNLGTASGIKTTHSTADLNFGAVGSYSYQQFAQIYLDNVTLGSSTQLGGSWNRTNWLPESFVRASRLGGTAGLAGEKTWTPEGTIIADTSYYSTASPSQKLTPSSATYKLESGSYFVPVASGQNPTVSVKVRESNALNGDSPELVVRRCDSLGITADTVLDTATSGPDVDTPPGTWETLSGQPGAVSADGVLEFFVRVNGTAGFCGVCDWSVTGAKTQADNLDAYWSYGLPFDGLLTAVAAGGGGGNSVIGSGVIIKGR
ncbi:right-handed parallel beta-helix repeat-containing protein [Candidatus Magnetobacterium casense]|uniref:Right-handed parallel beta-helix repeat-containing protein n=1 Tax=Candidatus Magnetobacterium casense TaxID=1455061 RepID=A0ABS6S0N4_9BACT|nr:right-handed parallel beta-helix repeat-containing protein [Candidatus Magnetobacterium casensis]MBV6342371.1 right-handed parallel beta-helix repeat-containing protein [Candidatus Magnetobacterium casensis]